MPLFVPPGYSQVSFLHNNPSPMGSKVVWSIGWSAPPTIDYLDGFSDWWNSDIKPMSQPGLWLERIEMRNSVSVLDIVVNNTGTGSGEWISPQVATLVQKRTGLAGRANRGRTFLPGLLKESDVNQGGEILGSKVTSIQGAMDSLLALATSTGDEAVLFHNGSSDPTIITQLLVSPQTATVRRRNRK